MTNFEQHILGAADEGAGQAITLGQITGKHPRAVPLHLAAYALHLAASNILLLFEGYKAMPALPGDR